MLKRLLLWLLGLAFLASLLAFWWQSGGSEPSKAYLSNPAHLLYRGFRIPGTTLVLFKRYYAIVESDPTHGLETHVSYTADGYNPFFITYPDNSVAAAGTCRVSKFKYQIIHDINDVKQGVYFNPRREMVSTVDDGTGVQTFFFQDGTTYWELHVDHYARTALTIWNPDGSVRLQQDYSSPPK